MAEMERDGEYERAEVSSWTKDLPMLHRRVVAVLAPRPLNNE